MKATTIKLEGKLLAAIEATKDKSESISAFVRRVLERGIRRERMQEAGRAYQNFLAKNSEEETWLTDWQSASLEEEMKD